MNSQYGDYKEQLVICFFVEWNIDIEHAPRTQKSENITSSEDHLGLLERSLSLVGRSS